MATQLKTFFTPEEYLALERAATARSEYFQGEIFAMSRVREAHSLIVTKFSG